MRHPRTILTLSVIAVLALATAAQAGGLPTLAGFQRDRVLTKEDGDKALRVAVTYAKPVGNKYVAYVTLSWGNLDYVGNGNHGQSFQQWKGELEVEDDGKAVVVSTEGFESQQKVLQQFDTVAYNEAVRRWQQKHSEMIQDSFEKRQKDRDKAFAKIKDQSKLAIRLGKIDQEHAARLNAFNTKMQNALAKLRQELSNQVVIQADRITKDDDDEIAWQSTTHGDTDGLLIKLILEDDDTDVKIKVGGLKINFETRRAPATETYTVNTNYRRTQYGSQARTHNAGTTVYRQYTTPTYTTSSTYCPPTTTYALPRTVIYRSTSPRRTYNHSRYRRSGININGGFTWSNGGLRVQVGTPTRTHNRSGSGHYSQGNHNRGNQNHNGNRNNRNRNQNRNDRGGRNNRRNN